MAAACSPAPQRALGTRRLRISLSCDLLLQNLRLLSEISPMGVLVFTRHGIECDVFERAAIHSPARCSVRLGLPVCNYVVFEPALRSQPAGSTDASEPNSGDAVRAVGLDEHDAIMFLPLVFASLIELIGSGSHNTHIDTVVCTKHPCKLSYMLQQMNVSSGALLPPHWKTSGSYVISDLQMTKLNTESEAVEVLHFQPDAIALAHPPKIPPVVMCPLGVGKPAFMVKLDDLITAVASVSLASCNTLYVILTQQILELRTHGRQAHASAVLRNQAAVCGLQRALMTSPLDNAAAPKPGNAATHVTCCAAPAACAAAHPGSAEEVIVSLSSVIRVLKAIQGCSVCLLCIVPGAGLLLQFPIEGYGTLDRSHSSDPDARIRLLLPHITQV
jgi:hypothetical protein